jgi:GntR family transcriptional regulator, transcriptional repressor for pyruvate dehydrogenase complex
MTFESEPTLANDIFRTIKLDEGSLSVQAAHQIRELIRTGELKKGDRLPSERELSDRLGVSRTVVREAIKMLRASGYVKVRMGVGSFVAEESVNILEDSLSNSNDPDYKKIADLHQVREVLEPAVAALAAQNATREDIEKMEAAIQIMEQNLSNGYRYIEGDKLFHIALAEATKNSVFTILLNSIVDLLQEARRLAISTPGAGERSSYYHRRILEAVKSRDAEEALLAMSEHMQQTEHDTNVSLRSKSNPYP